MPLRARNVGAERFPVVLERDSVGRSSNSRTQNMIVVILARREGRRSSWWSGDWCPMLRA